MYDYEDVAKNTLYYGQSTPPELNISHINQVPIALFVGELDPLANPNDSRWVRSQIRSVVHYEELPNIDHGAFFTGKDLSYFDNGLELVNQYNK